MLSSAVCSSGMENRVEKLLLTPEEAAARLSVGRTKMYELLRGRVIDSIKIDGLRRILPEALEA